MSIWARLLLAGILYLALLQPVSAAAGSEPVTVTIGILPCSDVVKTFEHFNPLAQYIEETTGFKVKTVFPKNESDLVQLFRKGNLDFIFHSPFGIADFADIIDEESLLKSLGPDGKDYEVGYMVARKDSKIKTLKDLKGKRVLFGMECSASRWVCARRMFEKNNIDIDNYLGSYTDGGCCEDISYNVYLKAADAGLVCQHYFDEQKELGAEHVEALAVIEKGDPTPTRIFAAQKNTPRNIIDMVEKSLLAIDREDTRYRDLVSITEISGFQRASPEEYKGLSTL